MNDLLNIPDFLQRTPGDSTPPASPTARDTGRMLREAKERGLQQRREADQRRSRERADALREYRKLFGKDAPHPSTKAASAEQQTVYAGILSRIRTGRA